MQVEAVGSWSCLVLGVIVDPLLRLIQSVGRIQFSAVVSWAPHILASCHRGPSLSSLRPPTLPLVFLAPSSNHQWCRVLLLLGIWLLPLPHLSCLWSEKFSVLRLVWWDWMNLDETGSTLYFRVHYQNYIHKAPFATSSVLVIVSGDWDADFIGAPFCPLQLAVMLVSQQTRFVCFCFLLLWLHGPQVYWSSMLSYSSYCE